MYSIFYPSAALILSLLALDTYRIEYWLDDRPLTSNFNLNFLSKFADLTQSPSYPASADSMPSFRNFTFFPPTEPNKKTRKGSYLHQWSKTNSSRNRFPRPSCQLIVWSRFLIKMDVGGEKWRRKKITYYLPTSIRRDNGRKRPTHISHA